MASINISEDDFTTLANAAFEANLRGDMVEAVKLDKIARKISAALSNAKMNPYVLAGMPKPKGLTWQEVPSTLI